MILLILILLIILYVFGFIPFLGFLNAPLFTIGGITVTLYSLLILALISWIIGVLPSPFRQIATVALILWMLQILGIFTFGPLSHIIVIALIIGLILYLLRGN